MFLLNLVAAFSHLLFSYLEWQAQHAQQGLHMNSSWNTVSSSGMENSEVSEEYLLESVIGAKVEL